MTGFQFWITADQAKQLGCTHHARMFGIIPGFFSPEMGLWVSRSDLLNPIEDALSWLWVTIRQLRGEEPDFGFRLTGEI